MNSETMSGIERDHFRRALSLFPSGLVVIATQDARGQKAGFTCQSFYSVSLVPPLVSFSVMKTSTTYPVIRETGAFSVSILSRQHHQVSRQMGRRGDAKWEGVDLQRTSRGNPVLSDSIVWLDCELRDEYEAGDHFIVVGTVIELAADRPTQPAADPLVFFEGGFRRLQEAGEPFAQEGGT